MNEILNRMNKALLTLVLFIAATAGSVLSAQEYSRVTNLPHLIINTEKNTPITSKDYYIYATLIYVDEDDVVTQYDSVSIRGRGNSTWSVSKKPYRIKFKSKEKFLGKGHAKAKSWTLIANALDKTLIRNAVTFAMGDFLGLKFNPSRKYIDLTLNGTFMGNYMISDHVEVRSKRVDIAEQEYPLPEDADVSGGYLLEVDGFRDGNYFATSRYGVPIRIHYPDEDEISDEQNQYIRRYMREFEQALSSSDFDDAQKGYRRWVDSVSLANWFLATEISGNIDGYFSTYFYKNRGDSLLYWGPLWDYDIAYANDNRKGDTRHQLMTDVGYGETKYWVNRMWADPWFCRLVNRRMKEAVDAGLENFMYAQIDSLVELMEESRELNYRKWGIGTRYLREYILFSTYDEYIDFMKQYIHDHISYLSSAFHLRMPPEPTPPFEPSEERYYRIVNVNTSTALCSDGDYVCAWTFNPSDHLQQWQVVSAGDGYYLLINRDTRLALTDPTEGYADATTNVGARLKLAEIDATDDAQLWCFTPQGLDETYNIVNKATQHTANLSGGSTSDGTHILSYTTDEKNATSKNRLWYMYVGGKIEEQYRTTDVASAVPDDYALAFDPSDKALHFACADPSELRFSARVYSTSGTMVKTFSAAERCSVGDLPSGVYIVKWQADGHTKSVKFKL